MITNGTYTHWIPATYDQKGRHYREGVKTVTVQVPWSTLGAVNPWYTFSLYFGWIGLSVLLTLLLLDRLKVHFYANKGKASARELLLANVHLMSNGRLKRLIPLFICIGINEVFIVADVMQAYVASVSPQSTVGYVLFCYSLTNLFMSAFIHTAAFHVPRMTFLWVGFITEAGILLVMWLWVPSKDDQAVFYVIVMTWSFSHTIWRTFGQRMLHEAFPDNWDSSFTIYHVGCSVGMSIGFLMKPFGKTEYKIYTVGFALVISMLTIVLSETGKLKQRMQFDIAIVDSRTGASRFV
uniref:Major facilitator superfamily associated domain-containing protein n=1 Tax=Trichuris muris TaxID=70415 RepID=A0A5S6QM26_TRIMR